jgi:hypothetical protein
MMGVMNGTPIFAVNWILLILCLGRDSERKRVVSVVISVVL